MCPTASSDAVDAAMNPHPCSSQPGVKNLPVVLVSAEGTPRDAQKDALLRWPKPLPRCALAGCPWSEADGRPGGGWGQGAPVADMACRAWGVRCRRRPNELRLSTSCRRGARAVSEPPLTRSQSVAPPCALESLRREALRGGKRKSPSGRCPRAAPQATHGAAAPFMNCRTRRTRRNARRNLRHEGLGLHGQSSVHIPLRQGGQGRYAGTEPRMIPYSWQNVRNSCDASILSKSVSSPIFTG